MACADRKEGKIEITKERIEHSYNRILRHVRVFFSKQLEIYDYHYTLLEKEREDFLKDVHSFKILIEKEKEKLKGYNKETVHQNSDASDACADSDESWFDEDEDDILLYSTECRGAEEKKEKGKVSINTVEKNIGEVADDRDFCAGIGQKDF